MRSAIIDQLKQVHAEMKAIRSNAEINGGELSEEERGQLEQLAAERDELINNMFFHTY